MNIIELLWGEHYWIYTIYSEPKDLGHNGVSRPRIFILLLHKLKGKLLFDPRLLYCMIRDNVTQFVRTRPRDYFIASDRDVQHSAMRLASRRGIGYRPGERDLSYLLVNRELEAVRALNSAYLHKTQEGMSGRSNRRPFSVMNLSIGPMSLMFLK